MPAWQAATVFPRLSLAVGPRPRRSHRPALPGARQESSRKLEENVQPLTGFRPGKFVFGITSNTLVRSSQSSSGPAGGASDGYGLGRGPDRRCTTTAAGALRVIV